MSDQKPEQIDDQPAPPSDTPLAKSEGQFTSPEKQAIHSKATAPYKKSQKESDTIESLSDEKIAEIKAKGGFQKFEITGLPDQTKPVTVYEMIPGQALEPPPSVPLNDSEFQSTVKLNVQITNVPEVSACLTAEEALQYANQLFEAGAQAVRPIKEHLSQPSAVNNDLIAISNAALNHLSQPNAINNALLAVANHFAQSPDQFNNDFAAVLGPAVAQIDHPLTPSERAAIAGEIMPMFFFEGNVKEPIHPETAQQLGLEGMSQAELTALGVRRAAPDAADLHMPEVPQHLKHLELQKASAELLQNMENKGRKITLARPGSEDMQYLQHIKADGCAMLPDNMNILLKENGSKIAALEEFLHGTQKRLGVIERVEDRGMAEVHVKEFMIRHARLLGLTENDVSVLEVLRHKELDRLTGKGWLQK